MVKFCLQNVRILRVLGVLMALSIAEYSMAQTFYYASSLQHCH